MKKSAWKRRIISLMKEAGTYKTAFNPVIETLATILERRDFAYEEFISAGGQACIEKVSDRGAKNIAKNPRLQAWQDLNSIALSYWRECCLSPAALKKLSAEALEKSGNDIFATLLEKITDSEQA